MDLIDQFLARYTKEYDFYNQSANLAKEKLEATLQAAGVPCIVTARTKAISRLEGKCRKRSAKKGPYDSIDKIFDDIVDLAGVRVALYFPGQIDEVDGVIESLFRVRYKKKFPEKQPADEQSSDAEPREEEPHEEQAREEEPHEDEPHEEEPQDPPTVNFEKRFRGYSATHYRVQLREEALGEAEKRYAAARIEIQVASVLMHAWAEVEHDLVYKPLADNLSRDEHAILDLLNGLVMSGEIALEQLQEAGKARVAPSNRTIADHYELATLLLGAGRRITNKPVSESGLGRVDQLFTLIRELGFDTPKLLRPYMEALHGNLERRPLAEQIIDALLAEDSSRYDVYDKIRAQRPWTSPKTPSEDELYLHIGRFMRQWMELEALVRDAAPPRRGRSPVIPTTHLLSEMNLLTENTIYDFDQLRRMRNLLVHGVELPAAADLDEATGRLSVILSDIKQRLADRGDNDQSL